MIWPADDPLTTVWHLTPDMTAPREARLSLRAWLSGLQLDSATGVGADLILSADELVTNAVTHGEGDVWLSARVDLSTETGPALVVSVTDGGQYHPAPLYSVDGSDCCAPYPDPAETESGRGLSIVQALLYAAGGWKKVTRRWNGTQVLVSFPAPELLIPAQRHLSGNADSRTANGTRTGCNPLASLSANTF